MPTPLVVEIGFWVAIDWMRSGEKAAEGPFLGLPMVLGEEGKNTALLLQNPMASMLILSSFSLLLQWVCFE